MKINVLKKITTKILMIFTLLLFVVSPFKTVMADNSTDSKIVNQVEEEKEDYSTLYIALVISLLSLGLVFLNKKDSKKEVKKESTKSIKNKEKKQAIAQRNNQGNKQENKQGNKQQRGKKK